MQNNKPVIIYSHKGLHWVESNYRCRMGEIDLIMKDKEYLVFVEVRSRVSDIFGGALQSIDYKKKAKNYQNRFSIFNK